MSKKFLGIDIGTSAIKLVELSGWREKRKLENYGEIKAEAFFEKPFRTLEKNILVLSEREIAQAIKALKEEAKIKTRQCIFSIPDFSTFFTNFELPLMTKEELSEAVVYEARQHIPLPLGEVTLDWEVIEDKASDREKTKLKILLVAVPNEVINQYQEIARLSNLQIWALEAEVFGLFRSLIPADEKRTLSIIDIGARTTICSIIDKRVLKASHSFDISGDDLTERIAKNFSVDYQTAQNLKEKYGLTDISLSSTDIGVSSVKNIKEILVPLIDVILKEIEKINYNFYQTEGKEIQKFIIAGGGATMPGLKEYFANFFKKETEIANPFSNIFYPAILEQTLKQIGPSYAIAVGTALRGFE
ncbi:MAG: type IV pilus assembly protein PilM [Patescibacteria group bacterium]|nr:type IV pilus assembly protein PilM [Patescibacteria group bacterium]